MSAGEAARELGISVSTLYAYVSRGLVRSEVGEGRGRGRRYRAEDVWRLKERKEGRRDPQRVVESALHWGAPVMESGIALISGGRLYYRGRDACELAARATIEGVAALIWTGNEGATGVFDGTFEVPGRVRGARGVLDGLPPVEAFQVALPLAAAEDPAAYDLRPAAVVRAGTRVLKLMARVAGGGEGPGIARSLRRGWAPGSPGAEALIDAALILCADHELPVSTFAARCVASSGATPYAVVGAGLAALQGVKHGGQTELVEAFLREVDAAGDARRAMAGRLRRGEKIPGFGHHLYPDGDPRGAELLRLTAAARPESPAVALSSAVASEALGLIGEHPTVDFGLATLARALGLPTGGALALFAIGRTVGWVGHAIEQYGSDTLIRPRARYVGEPPADAGKG